MGKSQLVLCLLALIGLGLGRVLHQAEPYWMGLRRPAGAVPSSQWPPEVSRLRPSDVVLETADGQRSVGLLCGGAFMHWGLVVGPESVVPDEPGRAVLDLDARSFVWVESQ